MEVYVVIVLVYDDLWSDHDTFLDSVFTSKEKAEKRAAEIEAVENTDSHAYVHCSFLDVENDDILKQNRIRMY